MKLHWFAVIFIYFLAACAPGSPPPSDDTVIIPATTKITDAATRAALMDYDPATGALRFTPGSAVLGTLKAGDVLVSEPSKAAPSGYLRKVQAIRQENGQTLLDTTQANLTDAVTQGELNAVGQLTGDDLARADLLPGMSLTAAPASVRPQAGIGDGYQFQLKFNRTFVPVSGLTARGQLKVDGSVEFNAGYGVNVGIKGCFELPPICVKNFQASVGLAQSSHLKITGDFQGNVSATVSVGTQYFTPKVFFIGPVPVVIVPRIELFISAGGQLSATFTFEARENVTAQLGARWTKDSGWKDISGFGIDGTVVPPVFAGSLTPRVGLVLTTSLKLYDVAGPEATLEGGLDIDAKIPRHPTWIVKGYLKGSLGFRVTLPIIGTVASYQTTLFDSGKELARAGNTPPTLALTGRSLTVNQGQSANLRAGCDNFGSFFYTVRDLEDGCGVRLSVVSDRDGVLTPDFIFNTPGARAITVTATDTQGASARLAVVLNVVNPPPTLILRSSGDPHLGEIYPIAATITDPNETGVTDYCRNTTWAVDAPDVVSPDVGCQVQIVFGTLGARQVRVKTYDSLGASTMKTLTLTVLPPLVNPYPRIVDAKLFFFERDCGFYELGNGATIDLTAKLVCPAFAYEYYAEAIIGNPANELLTYNWTLYATNSRGDFSIISSDKARFPLYNPGNASRTTETCRMTLTVTAPDPNRSKSLTAWTGRCTYDASLVK